jgi:hypothetical protein
VCKPEFETIQNQFNEVKEVLTRIETALFVGNGTPSLKTIAEVHDRTINGILWIGGVLFTAVIGVLIELHFKK